MTLMVGPIGPIVCTLPSQADGKTTLTCVCRSLLTVQKVACMTINPSWSVCLSCMYNVIRDFMKSHLSVYILPQIHRIFLKILLLNITNIQKYLVLGEFKYDFIKVWNPYCVSFILSKRSKAAVGGQIHPDLFTLFFTC